MLRFVKGTLRRLAWCEIVSSGSRERLWTMFLTCCFKVVKQANKLLGGMRQSNIIMLAFRTLFLKVQIPPRPDHLHGQNLPPRRTESAMLTEHYTTVVSNSPPELFHRHSGLQALCLSHKLVCAKVTAGDVDFLSAKSSEQFRYREFQNHST